MSYQNQQFDLNNAVSGLSPAIKQAVGEVDVTSEIWDIGEKSELLVSEIGNVCEETKKVIAGETRPENFVDNVRNALGDENKEKANAVATEINNQILIPILNAFKKTSMEEPAPNSQPAPKTFEEQNLKEQTTENVVPHIAYSLEPSSYPDRSAVMREIENPTPAEFSTIQFNKPITYKKLSATEENSSFFDGIKNKPPENLPVGDNATVTLDEKIKSEPPIIRTMPRDISNKGNFTTNTQPRAETGWEKTDEKQNLIPKETIDKNAANPGPSRGKFGHGLPPTIRQNYSGSKEGSENTNNYKPTNLKQSFIPRPPAPPAPTAQMLNKTVLDNSRAIPNSPTTTQKTETQKTTFTIPSATPPQNYQAQLKPKPQKTEAVDDLVEDKLTKTVSIPSEKKQYVVDPYREPLD